MDNYKKKTALMLWATRFGLLVLLAGLLGGGWLAYKAISGTAVKESGELGECPFPFVVYIAPPDPTVLNVVQRGSDEEDFLDRVQMVMLRAGEVALQMVSALNLAEKKEAEGDIRKSAAETHRRLKELQLEIVTGPCPKRCKRVRAAMSDALEEADRFYRIAATKGLEDCAEPFDRAKKAYVRKVAEVSRFMLVPNHSAHEVEAIIEYDCESLAVAACDWARAAGSGERGPLKSAAKVSDQASMTSEQIMAKAHREDPYLNGLWIVLNGKGYSPYLASCFIRWRSLMQANYFGIQNGAFIPVKQNNEVRFRALTRVTDYLLEHPNDVHAQAQKEVLLDQPNVFKYGMFYNPCCYYTYVRTAER